MKMRARVALQAMARHGTTTVEVKTGCGADEGGEMKILRVLSELRKGLVDVVPSFLFRPARIEDPGEAQSREDWKWVRVEFLPKLRRRGLVDFADLEWDYFTESRWTTCPDREAWCEGYFQVARSLGLGCKIHADTGSVSEAARMAVEHHAASIDHLEHATEAEAAVLSRSETVATLLPSASFQSGERYGPARSLIDSGAAVALASNYNPRETPTLSMQAVIALACHRMRLTPAEAITTATINGAHALGCADQVGSLEYGKFADLLILNVSDYRELAQSLGSNMVHMAMKRGEVIYEEGEVAPRPVEDLRPAW